MSFLCGILSLCTNNSLEISNIALIAKSINMGIIRFRTDGLYPCFFLKNNGVKYNICLTISIYNVKILIVSSLAVFRDAPGSVSLLIADFFVKNL